MPPTAGRANAALRAQLEARREEIEATALARVRAISDPTEVGDPAYAEGLRTAIAAAIDYGIETTGNDGERVRPIPVALLAQARLAARHGVSLDTVLRRYFAGYSLLGYFILAEAGNAGLGDGADLKRLLGAHTGVFDRLLAAVSEEHARESEEIATYRGKRRRRKIERLLAGEPLDTSEITYDFEGWHLGIAASGPEAERAVREAVADAEGRLLVLPRADDVTWAWLGSRRPLGPEAIVVSKRADALSFGEPADGLAGWRLTHRQAVAALPVAEATAQNPVRYASVALLACSLRDQTLTESLRELYLRPLCAERDGGVILRTTLRTYLAEGGNVTATAEALGVSPRTIRNRLRRAEHRIGRPLGPARADLEIALRIDEVAPAVAVS